MSAIAWAIFCAGMLIMPPRDKNSKYFAANNAIDCVVFIFGFCCLIYYSGR